MNGEFEEAPVRAFTVRYSAVSKISCGVCGSTSDNVPRTPGTVTGKGWMA